MKKTLFVSLFSGPGAGKSTLCAAVFYELKKRNIDCEMSLEYVKALVFEESFSKIENQLYIFSKQHHSLYRLNGKVDVVITDSPLLLSILYDKTKNEHLKNLVLFEYNKMNTINFFIKRKFNYQENGRMQTKEQAIEKDQQCLNILLDNKIDFLYTDADDINFVVESIIKRS